MRRGFVTSITQVLMIVTMLAPFGASSKVLKDRPLDPMLPGPFPVGVATTVFIDNTRIDNVTKKPRTLVTEIWYPATDAALRMPKNKYSDFTPGGITPEVDELIRRAYKMSAAEIDKIYWNEAHRNAALRKGRFPLIIFSHGNGGTRNQNTFWCDYLASHGYIIVSPDHTGNARWTIIDGKPVVFQGSERSNSAKDRPLDLSFLLNQMIRWDKGGTSDSRNTSTPRAQP